MDFLPLPGAPGVPHEKIRAYLRPPGKPTRSFQYSSPWADFPERSDLKVVSFLRVAQLREQFPHYDKEDTLAFLQAWLYFGVLSEFFENPIQQLEWVVVDSVGGALVSAAPLNTLLGEWRRKILQLSSPEKKMQRMKIDRLLEDAETEWRLISSENDLDIEEMGRYLPYIQGEYPRSDFILPDDLSLSIAVLYDSLHIARDIVFQNMSRKEISFISPIMARQFETDGWCTSEIARLKQEASLIGLYYASRLGPLPHHKVHGQCDMYQCRAAQVNTEEYQSRHISPDCSCKMIGLETNQLASAIDHGGLPLVRLIQTSSGREEVELRTTENTNLSYTAISHVWADGLGNKTSNKLPTCQLRRLQSQVNILCKSPDNEENNLFWMDTLCVPVGDTYLPQRSAAIADMVHTYRAAEKVLIINRELEDISVAQSFVELTARITRTQWFRRLWTLHEGVISEDLHFQLQDGTVSVKMLTEICQTSVSDTSFEPELCSIILKQLAVPLLKVEEFKLLSREQRIQHIWTAVQYRSTSNRGDETVCLANMLDIGLQDILAVPWDHSSVEEERMKAFIQAQNIFPERTLFESGPSRLNIDGFRWAPKSFVFRAMADEDMQQSHLVRSDPSGLHTSFPGLIISWKDLQPTRKKFCFILANNWDCFYVLTWVRPKTPLWGVDKDLIERGKPAIVLERDVLRPVPELAGVPFPINRGSDESDFEKELSDLEYIDTTNGVFVVIYKVEKGVFKCSLVGDILVERVHWESSGREALYQIQKYTGKESVQDLDDVHYFENNVFRGHTWCIG